VRWISNATGWPAFPAKAGTGEKAWPLAVTTRSPASRPAFSAGLPAKTPAANQPSGPRFQKTPMSSRSIGKGGLRSLPQACVRYRS